MEAAIQRCSFKKLLFEVGEIFEKSNSMLLKFIKILFSGCFQSNYERKSTTFKECNCI